MAEAKHRRRLPPWLIGLIVAVVVFAVAIIVSQALGFGDNPVLESSAALIRLS